MLREVFGSVHRSLVQLFHHVHVLVFAHFLLEQVQFVSQLRLCHRLDDSTLVLFRLGVGLRVPFDGQRMVRTPNFFIFVLCLEANLVEVNEIRVALVPIPALLNGFGNLVTCLGIERRQHLFE